MAVAVDAQFASLMNDMVAFSDLISTYLESDGSQRLWMIPAGSAGNFNPTAIAALGEPFDRAAINADLVAEYSGVGEDKVKVAMGLNVELGYMCMMERAFRERHRTVPRALALLAGRRKAHSDTTNVHEDSVEAFVQELLDTS